MELFQNTSRCARSACGWSRGVTLPEVLTVIAIVGILSAMAVPKFMRFTATTKLENSAQILGKDMEWAKLAATKSGMKVYLRFLPGSDTSKYEIWMENSDPVDNHFSDEDDSLLRRGALDPAVVYGIASTVPVAPGLRRSIFRRMDSAWGSRTNPVATTA